MVNTLAFTHHIYQCQEKVFAQPDFLIWILPLPVFFPVSEEDFSDVGTTSGRAAPSAIPMQEQRTTLSCNPRVFF